MPYITEERATELIVAILNGRRRRGRTSPAPDPGDLTWMLSELCAWYLEQGLNFERLNDVKGALESTKAEIHDRLQRPYEDRKRALAGRTDPFDDLEPRAR